MALKLSAKQLATIDDCSCPLSAGLRRKPVSRKAIVLPFIFFGLALYVVWALWSPGALWLLGIYGVLIAGSVGYRLIRGHTVWCSFKWSPVVALYVIGEGVASVNF